MKPVDSQQIYRYPFVGTLNVTLQAKINFMPKLDA